jgi:hypothetical protein
MLDLQYNPASGFYAAPPQMKANTGVFVIDDFGRQRMRPEELLNRWIVPLDRGVDFLTLHGGTKFAVPFRCSWCSRRTSISATRRRATRRSPTRRSCAASRTRSTSGTPNRRVPRDLPPRVRRTPVAYDAALVDQLIEFLRTDVGEPLRPCVPRDLVRQIIWESRYDGRAPEFTDAALARACRTYFALPEEPCAET